jgi:hypothetical protein
MPKVILPLLLLPSLCMGMESKIYLSHTVRTHSFRPIHTTLPIEKYQKHRAIVELVVVLK